MSKKKWLRNLKNESKILKKKLKTILGGKYLRCLKLREMELFYYEDHGMSAIKSGFS